MAIKKILTLNNEVEARELESLLNESRIPFNLKSFRDPAYDGIFQTQMGWGIIEADEAYQNEILTIYQNMKDFKNTGPEVKQINDSRNENGNIIKMMMAFIGGIIILIILTFFIKDYIFMKKLLKTPNVTKNYTTNWQDNISVTIYNDTGKTAWKNYDFNQDHNFEKSEFYSKSGKLKVLYNDENENGIHEKSTSYDQNGRMTEEAFDENEDFIYEKTIEYLPNGPKIIREDRDNDGFLETIIIYHYDSLVKEINILKN